MGSFVAPLYLVDQAKTIPQPIEEIGHDKPEPPDPTLDISFEDLNPPIVIPNVTPPSIDEYIKLNNEMPTVQTYWYQAIWASFDEAYHYMQEKYDRIKALTLKDPNLKRIYEYSYNQFVQSITADTILENPLTNFLIDRIQPKIKYPDVVQLRQIITISIIVFSVIVPLNFLLIVIILSAYLNPSLAVLFAISLIPRIVIYLTFRPNKSNNISPTVVIQHQSSYSFYVLTTVAVSTALWLLHNKYLTSTYLWAGMTMAMIAMVTVHQFSIREKSVSVPVIVYVLVATTAVALILSWDDTTLPIFLSYFTDLNLAHRRKAVASNMLKNFYDKRLQISTDYYLSLEKYGPTYADNIDKMFIRPLRNYQPATESTAVEMKYLHSWNIANTTSMAFFRYFIPLIVMTFFQWASMHETIGVQKVIPSKLNEAKNEARPPDKIGFYYEALSYHAIPTSMIVIFLISLFLQSTYYQQYDYIAILVLIYLIATYCAAKVFERFSASSWISLADSMKASSGQISKDYYFGNITSNLGTENVKSGLLTGTIIIIVTNAWALLTLQYSTSVVIALSSLPLITMYKLHQQVNNPHDQMMYLISLMISLTSYSSAIMIYAMYTLTGKCVHFYTFQIRNRNQTYGQPINLND